MHLLSAGAQGPRSVYLSPALLHTATRCRCHQILNANLFFFTDQTKVVTWAPRRAEEFFFSSNVPLFQTKTKRAHLEQAFFQEWLSVRWTDEIPCQLLCFHSELWILQNTFTNKALFPSHVFGITNCHFLGLAQNICIKKEFCSLFVLLMLTNLFFYNSKYSFCLSK